MDPFPARHRWSGRAVAACCVALALCAACDPAPDAPLLDLPPRAGDAPGGAEIARAIRDLDIEARAERIHAEVARGNVPDWLRRLRPVELTAELDGRARAVTVWVTPDYLAVGSDDDHFYIPLSPRAALGIADLVGASLPTATMVDAIWMAARVRLPPIRIQPDENMWSVRYFQRHSQLVQAQRRQYGARPGALVAGHKLDVVIDVAPAADTDGVALYGWHLRDGTPIQPLYRVPADSPPPFSLGIRMVHRSVLVDGVRHDLADILGPPPQDRAETDDGLLP
jgi:hypothetical protein